MCLDGGARRKGEIRTRAGLPHRLDKDLIYILILWGKKLTIVLYTFTHSNVYFYILSINAVPIYISKGQSVLANLYI